MKEKVDPFFKEEDDKEDVGAVNKVVVYAICCIWRKWYKPREGMKQYTKYIQFMVP